MRFLANENFPSPTVWLMRREDHDIIEVVAEGPGTPDEEVLAWARRDDRTLLTFDRDYGDLIFRHRHPAPPGVIYFRIEPTPAEVPAQRVLDLLSSLGDSIRRLFIIVMDDRDRWRDLP